MSDELWNSAMDLFDTSITMRPSVAYRVAVALEPLKEWRGRSQIT